MEKHGTRTGMAPALTAAQRVSLVYVELKPFHGKDSPSVERCRELLLEGGATGVQALLHAGLEEDSARARVCEPAAFLHAFLLGCEVLDASDESSSGAAAARVAACALVLELLSKRALQGRCVAQGGGAGRGGERAEGGRAHALTPRTLTLTRSPP